MSGVRIVQGPDTSNTQELILANSTYLDNGDFVTIDADGFLARTAAGDKIDGYYVGSTITAAADNETAAMVKVPYEINTDQVVFEMTSDQACAQTDVGTYADIKLATNAFQLDLAGGATGQMFVQDFDPDRDGSTTKVRVKIAEPQQLGFTQD